MDKIFKYDMFCRISALILFSKTLLFNNHRTD